MMLKKFRCLVLAMMLVLVVVSCTTFAADKPVKLVYGITYPINHFYAKGDVYFKELVEKNSKGQILIDFYPASQLGDQIEMTQATMSNAQQMTLIGGADLTQYWPKAGILDLPYLIHSRAQQIKVARKITFLIDQDVLAAKTGLRILNARIRSPRHLTTKFPVNKFEDIKGLKIRVSQNPVQVAIWKAFGTIPTSIPAADIYTALATGTIDAQENPFDVIYTRKLYEQVKYCALTSHQMSVTWMVINNNFWNSLTAAQQKILQDAADKNREKGIKDDIEEEKNYKQLLVKGGMKFTKPDVAPFIEKVRPVWGQFGDAEIIKKVQALK
jgi:tripartite ATP-independent transporter DctP family solute receptor